VPPSLVGVNPSSGHVSEGEGVVVVWDGHLGFGHGHRVVQKGYCPHLH